MTTGNIKDLRIKAGFGVFPVRLSKLGKKYLGISKSILVSNIDMKEGSFKRT